MKYPRILIFIFIILGCKAQSGSEFLWWEKIPAFVFIYEPEYSLADPVLETKLVSNGSLLCLETGEGGNLSAKLCISSDDSESVDSLVRVFHSWSEESLVPEYDIFLADGNSAKIGTYKKSDLSERFGSVSFSFLGEERLFSKTEAASIWNRFRHSRRIHSKSFDILFTSENKEILMLPGKGEAEIYLSIEFPTYESIDSFQNRILSKNTLAFSACSDALPEITEVFGESGSPSGRWIEIRNPNDFPICERGLELELFANRGAVPFTIGFIAPRETRVLGEPESNIESFLLTGIRWGDLRRVGNLKIFRGDSFLALPLPGGAYRFGTESYSWTNLGFSQCPPDIDFSRPEIRCMTPGFPAYMNHAAKTVPYCDPQDFELEELNPVGLRQRGELHSEWKYLDLLYTGALQCEASYLQIQWGTLQEPISLSKSLEPNQILTVGALPFLSGKPNFTYRNLSAGKLEGPISIRDRNSGFEKILWDGKFNVAYGIPNRIVLEKTDGTIVSVRFQSGKIGLHPKFTSPLSESVYIENPRTSPGQKAESAIDSGKSVWFSEVSWMGSYRETEPIAKDRFIETVTKMGNPESAVLEIQSGSGSLVSILFPLDDSLNLLSAGKSVCFPDSVFWKDPNFLLPNTGQNVLKLLDPDTGQVWDRFTYTSAGPGINDTRNKIRRSAYFREYSGTRIWEASIYTGKPFRNPACPMTEAHPGLPL